MDSKYDRKKKIQSLAAKFTPDQWEKLCKDNTFASHLLPGPGFNLVAAESRANQLIRPVKPTQTFKTFANVPVFQS